jgi:hypothetical protein
VSATVTEKEHVELLPAPSVAVHVTIVTPSEKLEPGAGEHSTVAAPQLSAADGSA